MTCDQEALVLGWQLSTSGHPISWHPEPPAEGSPLHLFEVDPNAFLHHTLLFAQSGSGKSFLVARIIEELALKTQARIVILDPNSDYAQLHVPEPTIYASPRYDPGTGRGILPTESSPESFRREWSRIAIRHEAPRLVVPLKNLHAQLFLDATSQSHSADMQAAVALAARLSDYLALNWEVSKIILRSDEERPRVHELLQAMSLCIMAQDPPVVTDLSTALGDLRDERLRTFSEHPAHEPVNSDELQKIAADNAVLRRDIAELAGLTSQASIKILRHALRTHQDRITLDAQIRPLWTDAGVSVIDKPSLPEGMCFTLLQHVIDSTWRLHERYHGSGNIPAPTILVIDEAHHLMPNDSGGYTPLVALRDALRRVAAEGRKYGLLLFLISQRPDKLDPMIASECANKLTMKVSPQVLDETGPLLGLSKREIDFLRENGCTGPGRVCALGPIAGPASASRSGDLPASVFYTAARRTKEGAPKIDPEWSRSVRSAEVGVPL